jgi:phage baseplate assembly protein gpV
MAIRELVELASRVAELERRFSGIMRHGTVEEVDPGKQIVRMNFGKDVDGKPFLSPWVPYAQIAGALKVHTPPSKGQQFTMLSPTGDWQQAVALPMTWSDQNKSPSSNGDENVLTYGNVKATIKDDLTQVDVGGTVLEVTSDHVKITVGGVTVEITDGGVAITGGKVTHDGKNIGSTHIHGGVVPGGGLTDVPAN